MFMDPILWSFNDPILWSSHFYGSFPLKIMEFPIQDLSLDATFPSTVVRPRNYLTSECQVLPSPISGAWGMSAWWITIHLGQKNSLLLDILIMVHILINISQRLEVNMSVIDFTKMPTSTQRSLPPTPACAAQCWQDRGCQQRSGCEMR